MPTWFETIRLKDVFHNEDMTFIERRDMIVKRIRASGWFHDGDPALIRLVEELADTEDTDAFDIVWNELYDIADADRIWIATF